MWTCISDNKHSSYKNIEKTHVIFYKMHAAKYSITSYFVPLAWRSTYNPLAALTHSYPDKPDKFTVIPLKSLCRMLHKANNLSFIVLTFKWNWTTTKYCSWQTSHDGIDIQSEVQPGLWAEAIGVSDFFVLSRSLWHGFHLFTQTSWYHGFWWIIVEIWWSRALVTTYK